jgi:hypothetical protein
VLDWVSNESPYFGDIVGDERTDLVCTRDGFFYYASIDWDAPLDSCQFHPISQKIAATQFGHGLAVGDVNSGGRMDMIHSRYWFAQPSSNPGGGRWRLHDVAFSSQGGGAEMLAYDVHGDNDVITKELAHNFGICWYEQLLVNGEVTFKRHLIMGSHPAENRYGVFFSELHSVNLVDIDGDGLKVIVTGKTDYSHHQQSP